MQWLDRLRDKNLTQLLLRAALALVFLYASISSFMHPDDWLGYLPQFARDHFNAHLLLHFFSVVEMAVALWLIWGKYVQWAALAAAALLAGIIVSNFSLFLITFRDAALMICALALFFSKQA
ncbi:MAG TPA: MauE/DoxX family redox-associated membrane protein [Candidatus Saccharimonadales bacterium]